MLHPWLSVKRSDAYEEGGKPYGERGRWQRTR